MRLFVIYLLLITAIAPATAQTPKVVLIIADGIPADVMEKLQPPAFQKVISGGIYKRAYVGGKLGSYSQTPTISAPGYNNMLTGTWGYKHNVWDNGNQHPNYNYPSIFRILKTQRPKSKTAIFSTWLDNRTMLLGAGLPQTNNLEIDYVFDGYEKDTVQFPHNKSSFYIHQIDEQVVHVADSVIRENGPDLSWIYLEYTDDIGHAKGTSPAQDSAILLLDNQLSKIAAAIEYREAHFKEKWLLVITTDHGRDSISGHGHGGQSQRERTTWMVMNKKLSNEYFASADPAIVDILPSVANFLQIKLPLPVRQEIDGVPFIGAVSISDANIVLEDDLVKLSWKSFAPAEKVAIYISYTDNAKSGNTDHYQLIGTVSAGDQAFIIKMSQLADKNFYKIVLAGKYNTLNLRHTSKSAH